MAQLLKNFAYDVLHYNDEKKKEKLLTDQKIFSYELKGPITIDLNRYCENSIDLTNEKLGSGLSFELKLKEENPTIIYDIMKSDLGTPISTEYLKISVIKYDSLFGPTALSINLINDEGCRFSVVVIAKTDDDRLIRRTIKKWNLSGNEEEYVFGYYPDLYDYTGLALPEQ